MSFLNEIEPLKQSALAELKATGDLAALEQAKGAWIGAHGRFTALMKQLGTLSKEERPAAGKLGEGGDAGGVQQAVHFRADAFDFFQVISA